MENQKARELAGTTPRGLSPLGYAYGRAGKKDDALKVLNELLDYSKQGLSVAYDLATVYISLGEKEKALTWLEKAVDEHDSYVRLLKNDFVFDPLRPEPRFVALLKKTGLEK